MQPVRHVIYLHGFASSPGSSKARRFEQELGAHGVAFSCPDLNLPAFETLTVTRMLNRVSEIVSEATGPVGLVGSSLGGFVALHAAARHPGAIDRMVLLAPAVDFGGNRVRHVGEHGIDEWRRTGSLRVFHYAFNESRDVWWTLYEDAAQYDAFAVRIGIPTLVFQGRRDDSVDPAQVERWASGQPCVDLRLVDDGHQLSESIDLIWEESARFFGLSTPALPT